ncbi:hypothetical protein AB0H83_09530 [Dactylosporangium sp. NPDC050688]|uniref:hypothetical protein n=1 Tax=Dactylosporangium sp. NPDC050688 TaxID=3157217 RepID=UPI0034107F35
MAHVLARLAGYGLVLTPHWPFGFERDLTAPGAVLVTHGRQQALVDPATPTSHPGVVDIADGPTHPYWLIETSQFAMAWPAGYALESPSDPHDGTPFYLHGPDEQLIFPQGPAVVAGPDALVAPGQTVLQRGSTAGAEVVEVGYQHEGEPWWQAHFLLPHGEHHTLVLTAQSRYADAAGTRAAAQSMLPGAGL